jgi:hypothetical protein
MVRVSGVEPGSLSRSVALRRYFFLSAVPRGGQPDSRCDLVAGPDVDTGRPDPLRAEQQLEAGGAGAGLRPEGDGDSYGAVSAAQRG